MPEGVPAPTHLGRCERIDFTATIQYLQPDILQKLPRIAQMFTSKFMTHCSVITFQSTSFSPLILLFTYFPGHLGPLLFTSDFAMAFSISSGRSRGVGGTSASLVRARWEEIGPFLT
jgi:hypothetical protein